MSKICKNCGETLDDGALYCYKCKHNPDEEWTPEKEEKQKKKNKKTILLGRISIIVIVALIAGVIICVGGCAISKAVREQQIHDMIKYAYEVMDEASINLAEEQYQKGNTDKWHKENGIAPVQLKKMDPEKYKELESKPSESLDHIFVYDNVERECFQPDAIKKYMAYKPDQCRYIMEIMAFKGATDALYTDGNKNQHTVEVETVLYVYDAQEKELIHICHLGSDVPSGPALNELEGEVLYDKVEEYILELVK